MSKFGNGHGLLLLVVVRVVALIPKAFDEVHGATKFWNTVLYLLAIWTIASLLTAFGYVAGRRLLGR